MARVSGGQGVGVEKSLGAGKFLLQAKKILDVKRAAESAPSVARIVGQHYEILQTYYLPKPFRIFAHKPLPTISSAT
jgi:hypothetical protein